MDAWISVELAAPPGKDSDTDFFELRAISRTKSGDSRVMGWCSIRKRCDQTYIDLHVLPDFHHQGVEAALKTGSIPYCTPGKPVSINGVFWDLA